MNNNIVNNSASVMYNRLDEHIESLLFQYIFPAKIPIDSDIEIVM